MAWFERIEKTFARRSGYILLYSALFFVVMACALLTLLVNGKSILSSSDGVNQHYTFFVYFGQWVRDSLYQVLMGRDSVTTWDPNMGYGTDMFSQLASSLADPFSLLSVFVPPFLAEYAYGFIAVLRLYLAGLAFSAYSLYHKNGRFESFVGTIAYVFSGATVVLFSQSGFISMMIILPLLLLGADRIFDGKGPFLFIAMLVWAFPKVQMAFVLALLLVAYCLVRVFVVSRERRVRRILLWVGKFVGYSCIALGIMAVILLPMLANTMSDMDRLGVERAMPMLFSVSYYSNLFIGFISHASLNADGVWGFGPLAFIALVLIACRWKENKGLLVALCAMLLGVALPLLSSAMNAFQYPSNRWFWAFSFCVSYVIVKMLPELKRIGRREKSVLLAAVAVYGLVAVFFLSAQVSSAFFAEYALLVSVLFVCLFGAAVSKKAFNASLIVVVCLGGVLNYVTFLSPNYEGWVHNAATLSRAYDRQYEYTSSSALKEIDDDSVWRYDDGGVAHEWNSNILTDYKGIDFYSSLYNNDIDAFHRSVSMPSSSAVLYQGLDSRSALEALMGVKYFIDPLDSDTYLPYQFRRAPIVLDEDQGEVHKADVFLPLAFTYDQTLSRDEFETLDPIQKQEVLLQAAVVEGDAGLSISLSQLDTSSEALDYRIAHPWNDGGSETGEDGEIPGIELLENGFRVTATDSSLKLKFDAPKNAELYVAFEGLTFTPASIRDSYTDEEWKSIGFFERSRILDRMLFSELPRFSSIRLWNEGAEKSMSLATNAYHMYAGHHDFAFNLGYDEEGRTEVLITFSELGTYTFENLSVITQPMTGFDEMVEERAKVVPGAFSYGGGFVSGDIAVPNDGADGRMLYFSIPYSEGWSAMVDGESVELEKVNIAFMGIGLEPGEHHFELRYQTPYLVEGAVVSLISLATLVIVLVRRRRCCRGAAA